MNARFSIGVIDLKMVPTPIAFTFPFPPDQAVQYFREYFGPTKMAFATLDADGLAALKNELVDLWIKNNRATDRTTHVESVYPEVSATHE